MSGSAGQVTTQRYPFGRTEPLLFCFCGPIASGKSTICQRLTAADPTLMLSVSTTTRAPRPGEAEGIHYYFVTEQEFLSRVSAGRFFEHARVGENLYGTEVKAIDAARTVQKDVLLDIDFQGVQQLKDRYPQQTVPLFVFPPSAAELKSRLSARNADSEDRIRKRLELAKVEIEKLKDPAFSKYLLLNDTPEQAVELAQSIIAAERAMLSRVAPGELQRITEI